MLTTLVLTHRVNKEVGHLLKCISERAKYLTVQQMTNKQ